MDREASTALTQVRSGFSLDLQNFETIIRVSETPLCFCCSHNDNTVQDTFNCPKHPINISPIYVWLNRERPLQHLGTWSCFDARLQRDRLPVEVTPRT